MAILIYESYICYIVLQNNAVLCGKDAPDGTIFILQLCILFKYNIYFCMTSYIRNVTACMGLRMKKMVLFILLRVY